jgi:hypothetical protein
MVELRPTKTRFRGLPSIEIVVPCSALGVDVVITIFRRFLTIFGEKKLAFFSKTNVMIKFLHNTALFGVKNANFLLIVLTKTFLKS